MILPPPPNGIAFALPGEAATLTVQAIVALPPLTPGERLILAGALRSAIAQTEGYSRGSILAMAASPDGTVQALAADHLRIGFHLQTGRGREALTLLEAVLVRPAFFPDPLNADIAAAGSPRDLWSRIGLPVLAPVSAVPGQSVVPDQARAVWAKVVRPERLVVTFGGVGAAELEREWSGRKIGWLPVPGPNYRAEAKPIPPAKGPSQVAVLEGTTLAGDAELGPTLLALTVLGAGKGSLGWKALRTGRGASYRIEATLAGVSEGWRPRLVFDVASGDEGADVKERLLKAIEGMEEADLQRAQGYLAASLRGEAYDVLFAPSGRRLTGSLPDRAYLAAYLRLKTGRLGALPPVPETTLEELRTSLKALVEGAALRFER